MLSKVFRGSGHSGNQLALTRIELVVVLAVFVLLGFVWLPAMGRNSGDSQDLVCVNNLRQIALAAAAYAGDNSDALPHPTWGSVDGSAAAGPDGWAYATKNNGAFPNAPSWIPSVANLSGPYGHTNQLPFYEMGQLSPYLGNQRIQMCPLDWTRSMESNPYKNWYRARYMKLTSYTMNGAVCGYGGQSSLSSGLTYKLSAFPGSGLLLWGADETMPFNFNDAASNPANASEGVGSRHHLWAEVDDTSEFGGSMVSRFDGSAGFLSLQGFNGFRNAPRPNDLLCGPGFE